MTEQHISQGHWVVDKKIPAALIVAIAIQTGGVAYYFGQMATRITNLEQQIGRMTTNADRLTRLEVKLEEASKTLARIDEKIHR